MIRQSGFTLVEILIATAIMALLTAIALPIGLDSYRSYVLSSETRGIVSILRRAQALSFANSHAKSWGVSFQSGEHILFQGDSYALRNNLFDEVYIDPPVLNITSTGDVVFAPIVGSAQASTTVTISNGVRTQSVLINEHGTIFW